MGGIFIVSEENTVGMAGWAYDNVTRLLKAEIDGIVGERILEDIDSAELSGLAMLNLTEYTSTEMQELARALGQVEQTLRAAGPESFADPKTSSGPTPVATLRTMVTGFSDCWWRTWSNLP